MSGTEGEIILCFECGTKNRLKVGWTGAPVCGKCGEPLPVTARPVAKPPAQEPTSTGSTKRPSWFPVVAISFVLVVILGVVYGVQQRAKPVVDYSDLIEQGIQTASGSSPSNQGGPPAATAQPLDTTGLTEVSTAGLPADPSRVQEERSWDRIDIVANEDAWIEIRRPGGGIVVSKVLKGGQSYSVPEEPGLILNTGNAGGIVVALNGMNLMPLGGYGEVKRNITLRPMNPGDPNPLAKLDPDNPFAEFAQLDAAPAAKPADPASLPPGIVKAVPVKPGVLVRNTKAEAIAPFQIKTSSGEDYYVKLVDQATGKTVVGIFVKGGQTLKVKVPVGTYKMRYASGQVWQGLEKLFGDQTTSYSASNEIFDFSIVGDQISGYTVELIQQVNGNLESHEIDAKQF
jgi:hypothetical protein